MNLKEIKEIGSRGVLFTFEFGDSVYLIKGKDHLFLCDTNEGRVAMEHVKEYLSSNDLLNKKLYIFNSHSDWDHIWGNDAFEAPIIAHKTCYERMKERAELDLDIVANFHDGSINIKYPTITFENKLTFESEGVEFIHAPGHTIDSSICFDKIDRVVYVGDLLEKPIPNINYLHVSKFMESLELIKDLHASTIVTTHSNVVDDTTLIENLFYVRDFIDGKYLTFTNEIAPLVHQSNRKNVLMLEYEDKARQALKDTFNYPSLKKSLWDFIKERHNLHTKNIWDIRDVTYHDLERDLKDYYGSKISN